MEEEGSSSKEDPPVPPQPPQFSICSALPGSPEWFSYWANEARETFEYNRRIAEYGQQMELWSRKITGLSVEDTTDAAKGLAETEPPKQPPTTAETQTIICQQEECTSSDSLQNNGRVIPGPPATAETQTVPSLADVLSSSTFPTVVTLDGSEIRRNVRMLNTNPYMDIFNELMDFPDNTQDHLDSPEVQRYFSHEVEIIRENLKETEVEVGDAKSKLVSEQAENIGDEGILNSESHNNAVIQEGTEPASDAVENKTEIAEDLHPIKETVPRAHLLQENVETHISDVVKNIFNGLTGFVLNIKDGISGIINEIKADAPNNYENRWKLKGNNEPVDFQQAYVNNQWKDMDEFSQDGRQTPRSLNSHTSNNNLIPDPQTSIASSSDAKNQNLPAVTDEVLINESKKTPAFRASMELGAFEINTWTESNGSTVRSGTTCRILCFSFKRVTTNEGTRLVFDKSVIDDDSLKVIPQSSGNRFCLTVTASRNGKLEELTIFLPAHADFEEIKIVEISKRYLSVSIPFASPYAEMNKRNRHSSLLDEAH